MTENEFIRKLSKEFDEKYGKDWESEEQIEEAMDYFMSEKAFNQVLDVLRIMFLESSKKDDFVFKTNIAFGKFIIQYQRSLNDKYLSDDRKKDIEYMLGVSTDIKAYVNELYKSYRQSFPLGTEAEPEPRPKEFDFENDLSILTDEDWLSVENVADILGLKVETIYAKVQKREILSYKSGKHLKFNRDDINEYVKKSRRKSMDEIDAEAEKRIKRK